MLGWLELREPYCKKTAAAQSDPANTKTLVVDYSQNMQLPFMGSVQSGNTYYYTPIRSVFNLGVVNTGYKKIKNDAVPHYMDHLYAHIYGEADGGKGGNNVASLIMKTLESLQWIPKNAPNLEDAPELNIVFDNCPGAEQKQYCPLCCALSS